MGYWDYTPSGWGRPKPLTKAQIRKLQDSYKKADIITAEVRKKEEEEQNRLSQKIEDELKLL